jgi:hypothetical protein
MKYLVALLVLVPAYVFSGMLAFADGHTNQLEKETPKVYWAKKPIQCGPPEGLIDLVKGYGELPLLTANGLSTSGKGETVQIKLVFAVNQETGSWTLIELNSPSQACVLGSGEGYTINKLPPLKQETKYNVSRKLS